MGARQSQDESHGASPVEISAPQTHHQHPSHHRQDLPTLGSYTHLQHPSLPVLRPHTHTQPRPDSHPRQQRPGLESGDLLELDLALSTLQRRLAARAHSESAPRDQPHTHHRRRHHHHHPRSYNAALGSAMPFIFVRDLSSVKCPLCSKEVLPGNMEEHLVLCMAKPRVTYNADTLTQESGECSICLEDLLPGDEIARLPCLCVYHLKCLQQWFKVSQTCPEHPDLS